MKLTTLAESYGTRGFAGAIYGQSGVGKTSLLNTLPPEKTLLVDIEGGMSVLGRHMGGARLLTMPKPTNAANSQDFRVALNELYSYLSCDASHSVSYVIFDSASELETYFQMAQALANGQGFVRMKEYGEAAQLAERYIIQFRDLRDPSMSKVNRAISTIFICGEIPIEITRTEDLVITNMFPMLTKKFAQRVSHRLDFVARLEMNANGQQLLRMQKTQEIMAKSRFRSLGNVTAPRLYIDDFYARVVQVIEKDIAARNLEPEPEQQSQKATASAATKPKNDAPKSF